MPADTPMDYELLDRLEFDAQINALKMFVLLAVPEPRRRVVLSLLQRMVLAHSHVPDDLQEMDHAMLRALDQMQDWSRNLAAFERLADHLDQGDD